jgi:hypothetical protein
MGGLARRPRREARGAGLFALIILPFAFGYFVAGRLLHESSRPLRWSLAYALGLLSFLIGVNAFFHFVTLRQAVYSTLAVLAAASLTLLLLPSVPSAPVSLGRWERLSLTALALTAFFDALFWQMRSSDDDYFIHAPLMAMYLRDIFPPRNPIFPDLPLFGHYGRDLTISALSTLVGERFLETQYVVTALNHAVLVLVAHFTARRYLRSPGQALMAVCFAYLGVNNVGRHGLLETFQNNNTFANLFLFVNIYLFLTAIGRSRALPALVSGLALGTYSLIYETHFGVLALALAAFPFVVSGLRRRWRLRHFAVTGSVLCLAGLLVVVQGGTLTDVASRHVWGTKAGISRSEDERRMTQEIRVGFPKPGFLVTSPFGGQYPIWSWQLVRESGVFVAILPLTLLFMIVRRKPLGILIGMIAVASLLVPAAVDFGAFNSESLRFLMLGGVGAAMLCGISLGAVWEWTIAHRPAQRYVVAAVMAGILAVSFWPAVRVAMRLFRDVLRTPSAQFLLPEDWACSQVVERPCAPIDVATAVALRAIARPGERTLTSVDSDNPNSALMVQSVLATFSRTFVVGPGIRVVPEGTFSMTRSYIEPLGFRARAFWSALDVSLLDDMRVNYLFVDPEGIGHHAYHRLRNEPRLERMLRQEDAGGLVVREVYRLKPPSDDRALLNADLVRLTEVEWPALVAARHVYHVPVVVSGVPITRGSALRISYRLRFPGGPEINGGDEVRQRMPLEPTGVSSGRGAVWLATPYEPGEYEVRFWGSSQGADVPLWTAGEEPALFRITVR